MHTVPLLAGGEQVVVDLTGTEHNARDLPGIDRRRVVQDLSECAARQILDTRDSLWMPQQALGREDHERLTDAAPVGPTEHLAAQQVEVLGRSSAVGDLDIVLGAEREEALDAGARMLGPLAFEAVREQQHEAARLAPLLLGAYQELVDHDLGAVGEVAELRLPENQRQGIGHTVAELEA